MSRKKPSAKFGLVFRQLRESQGKTGGQVASGAAVSKGTVSKFENGKADIQVSTLVRLFRQVGCAISVCKDVKL